MASKIIIGRVPEAEHKQLKAKIALDSKYASIQDFIARKVKEYLKDQDDPSNPTAPSDIDGYYS